ncbi:methyltransferase domain-containing protein [Amycolatopsis sp. NPDC059090]|uniref:methyltransferase domain-containing protein n=1 Tax=unclassified Amycolatopsis TaxID=2618356 RepID=UPI0036700985
MYDCRICGGVVAEFLDFGRQPISDAFLPPHQAGETFTFHLVVGICGTCAMVQQRDEVPREKMFHQEYPYRSSESAFMSRHFEGVARQLIATELTAEDPFIVEIGSNDGVMLRTVGESGIRHLGVDPTGAAAAVAEKVGVRVRVDFFDEALGAAILAEDGPADVIFAANTFSHITYLDSIFCGIDKLLAENGVFVFEERYLADIIGNSAFDQVYDEHFYLFSVRSVQAMACRFGFELVDVTHLPVHGGTLRYVVARPGKRRLAPSVAAFLEREAAAGLADLETFRAFAARVRKIRADLMALLHRLRDEGKTVVGYGATAKSATVTSYCEITSDLVAYTCDSTPAKQGLLMPGSRVPVRPPSAFAEPYPDYALLFAWNHAEEIMSKEKGFHDSGGKWILYVPEVRVV